MDVLSDQTRLTIEVCFTTARMHLPDVWWWRKCALYRGDQLPVQESEYAELVD